jgi:hypothetical protein
MFLIGNNVQISLGEEFAGKTLMVELIDAGNWIIKTGEFSPQPKMAHQNIIT